MHAVLFGIALTACEVSIAQHFDKLRHLFFVLQPSVVIHVATVASEVSTKSLANVKRALTRFRQTPQDLFRGALAIEAVRHGRWVAVSRGSSFVSSRYFPPAVVTPRHFSGARTRK